MIEGNTLCEELNLYRNEKKITELAVDSSKKDFSEMLKGSLGEDMMAVLNGERVVDDISRMKKIRFKLWIWLRKMFRVF